MSTLDTFVQHTRPPPKVAATSQEIRDRASTFVGYALRARSAKEAEAAVSHIRRVLHGARPASHEIAAWRWMTLKPGRTGLGEGAEDDFEVQSGSHDDGERWGGSKILNAMKEEGVLDAVVVVSRWCVILGKWRDNAEMTTKQLPFTFMLGAGTGECNWAQRASLISRHAHAKCAARSRFGTSLKNASHPSHRSTLS